MTLTILITGSSDGIGLETAKALAAQNHNVLLHGRNETKLAAAAGQVAEAGGTGSTETYCADLAKTEDVTALAAAVAARHETIDVLINNAGVFRIADPLTSDGLDARFMVNTIAPYMLTRQLLPLLGNSGRVINLSSAAQAPVNPAAFDGSIQLDDGTAYAQSKLALTMWSNYLAHELGESGPVVVAVNPGSFLGTKMVKEAYGSEGKDIGIGVDILTRAATSAEFSDASGQYYDNDAGRFSNPHADALDQTKNKALVDLIETTIESIAK